LAGLLELDDVGNLGVDLFQRRVQLLGPLHPTPRARDEHGKGTQTETEQRIHQRFRTESSERTVTPDLSSVAGRDAYAKSKLNQNDGAP
jgi:hypothetical protein